MGFLFLNLNDLSGLILVGSGKADAGYRGQTEEYSENTANLSLKPPKCEVDTATRSGGSLRR